MSGGIFPRLRRTVDGTVTVTAPGYGRLRVYGNRFTCLPVMAQTIACQSLLTSAANSSVTPCPRPDSDIAPHSQHSRCPEPRISCEGHLIRNNLKPPKPEIHAILSHIGCQLGSMFEQPALECATASARPRCTSASADSGLIFHSGSSCWLVLHATRQRW